MVSQDFDQFSLSGDQNSSLKMDFEEGSCSRAGTVAQHQLMLCLQNSLDLIPTISRKDWKALTSKTVESYCQCTKNGAQY